MSETNLNLDAHSSLIIADGSIVEINGQKVLLTIVKDGDKPEPKVIDLHKDSWGVYNDGSQRFKDTVVKWLNEKKNEDFNGDAVEYYYGIYKDAYVTAASPDCFTHILTLDEFCALVYPLTSEAGSELFGKFVRYAQEGYGITDKWFKIEEIKGFTQNPELHFVLKGLTGYYKDECFDLFSPLTYNPETLIGKYYEGYKIEGIMFSQNGNNLNCPYFIYDEKKLIACKDITPSDVTDTPPIPSLKYEDCFERVKPKWTADHDLNAFESTRYYKTSLPTERQAKQLAATIKLMTIAHDANGKDFVKKRNQILWFPVYIDDCKEFGFWEYSSVTLNQIGFKDKKTAERAYEANKEIFHDYFGIND